MLFMNKSDQQEMKENNSCTPGPVGIIVLGPSPDLFPISDIEHPKFMLPFLNRPLLNHAIDHLLPIASKICIISLERYKPIVEDITSSYLIDIEIFCNKDYEGMSHCFRILKEIILDTTHFILCKGDIFFKDPIKDIYEAYIKSNDDVHAFVYTGAADGPIITFDTDNYMYGYNTECIAFKRHKKLSMTVRYHLYNFFICKADVLSTVNEEYFGFKSGFIPHFIKNMRKVKLNESSNIQVLNLNDYMKQLEVKNGLPGQYGSCTESLSIHKTARITGSVVGRSCDIGRNTIIEHCILLDNAKIGEECVLVDTIVGFGAVIPGSSKLQNSRIAGKYVFDEAVDAKEGIFSHDHLQK